LAVHVAGADLGLLGRDHRALLRRSALLTEFVLSGYPHLEEAYWFGEGVLPLLRERGLWQHPAEPAAAEPASIPFATAGTR
ncbi:hypothetical protein ABZW49_49335, partial [Nonomuraea wenchangensis]